MADRLLARRYRLVGVALAASAGLHAAVLLGVPGRDPMPEPAPAVYSARLEPVQALPAPVAAPPPPHARKRSRPRPRLATPALLPDLASVRGVSPDAQGEGAWDTAQLAAAPPLPPLPEPEPVKEEPPEQVALAAPSAEEAAISEPEPFPVEALPANVSITYKLTSAIADGRAEYRWSREGDRYTISGEAAAEGFFTLFLEGQVTQEASGSVTARGLRPERFRESKPHGAPEGIDFDWEARQVTQDRGERKTVSALTDNTVDWLSMIFQLAHRPPTSEGPLDLQVFTQRKLYRFRLEVLGVESIEIPMGTVRALHLRHVDPKDASDVVDVWLGLEQFYLPVKMRYPVARNRLMVEQIATDLSSR